MNRQKQHRGAAAALAVLVLAAVLLFVGGSWLEKRSQKPETRTELPQETAETMEVDGVTYRRRTDLTTILVMGIDHDSEVEAEGSYQGGQADFQRLIVIDSKDKTVRQLKIDRDTMAEVTVLGMLGNPVGTTQMQISLAHGFGDGKEESCGYARDAVSRLLQGENIDFYLAMSLDGISVLNEQPLYRQRRRRRFEDELTGEEKPKEMSREDILRMNQIRHRFTRKEIEDFIGSHMEDGVLETDRITLQNDEDFEKLILAYDLSVRRSSPYRVVVQEEQLENGEYRYPRMAFFPRQEKTDIEKED